MLAKIPIFSAIVFGVLYPLGFWVHFPDPIVQGFRRFNLGLASFVGGLGIVGLLFQNPSNLILYLAIVWLLAQLLTTAFFWNKENINPKITTIPVLIGIILIGKLHPAFVQVSQKAIWSTIVGGGVLSGVVFATVLGHWYLNVQGLALEHLKKATNYFWGFVILRAIFDTYMIFAQKILYRGDTITLFAFMQKMDGVLLWVAIFFGTLLPLICNYFVIGTIKVKSTQSATGILYAILIGVFMGDLAYKYYLFNFGIAL